ncbi:hypothetical protein KSP40_PGU014015 [Platanthera guangdongensis]|uniref:Uncharacterized protein n=1 Tax=Platanthera guangdongensis TaxID=2320717 RepID=A0ABR2LQ86_9ASPA
MGCLGQMSEESADSVIPPAGVWMADGGAECWKETGEDGGAMNGNTIDGGWLEFSGCGAAI